jgi:hypothetical protein
MSSVRLRLAPPGTFQWATAWRLLEPAGCCDRIERLPPTSGLDGIDIVKEEHVRPVHRLQGPVREKTLSDKNQAWTRWHFFPVTGIIHA